MEDTWIVKHIRPIALAWVLLLDTVVIVSSLFGVELNDHIGELLFWATSISLGFYFGGRTFEKSRKIDEEIVKNKNCGT